MTQYYSRVDARLNGDVYNIPFSYTKESEISVYINDEIYTDWIFLNESQVKLTTIPSDLPTDTVVSIRRTTNITKKVIDYSNQSMLSKESLNSSQDQLLNAVQELYDNNTKFNIDIRADVDEKVEKVSDATQKINQLEEAVSDAKNSANEAQQSANAAAGSVETITAQGEQLIEDISKEADRIETVVDKLDKNVDTILNHVAFSLFDTKIADHILEGNEAKGWALQGTYVTGALYPDFYNQCISQKEASTESEVALGDDTITIYSHSNGHKFYDIADKSTIDLYYETNGIADFYGVDVENERIFLPRNKYFQQLTDDVSKINQMMEAGLPNITGSFGNASQNQFWINQAGAFKKSSNSYTGNGTSNTSNSYTDFDASWSNPIYGNSDTVQPPSSLKLLYYCVGNTVVNDSEIDAGALVATMENKANTALDNVVPCDEFKNNSISWSMPDYTAGITITMNSSTPYTAPADGVIDVAIRACGSTVEMFVNDIKIGHAFAVNYNFYSMLTGQYRVKKGDVVSYSSGGDFQWAAFFPMKGVNND